MLNWLLDLTHFFVAESTFSVNCDHVEINQLYLFNDVRYQKCFKY